MNPGGTIFVFRTNAGNDLHIETLRGVLDGHGSVIEWSIDLEDVDKVLRLVCSEGSAEEIREEIRRRGLDCEELE